MTLLTAGFVDGSRVRGEMLRRALWASTSGATGIVGATDLRVSPTTPASGSVIVGAGSAVIESAFANAAGNSYIVSNDQALTVAAPSAAGTYRVCLTVRDPQYAGQTAPPDPLTNSYTDVYVGQSFPVGVPYVYLGDAPRASAGGNITSVTDKRAIAVPRSQRLQDMRFPASNVNMSKSEYQSWPLSDFAVTVPTWATYLMVTVSINGVEYTGTDTGRAGVRVVFGSNSAQNGIVTSKGASRQTAVVIGNFTVPAADRGQLRYIGVQGYQTAGAGSFQLDYQSAVVYDWEFVERPA